MLWMFWACERWCKSGRTELTLFFFLFLRWCLAREQATTAKAEGMKLVALYSCQCLSIFDMFDYKVHCGLSSQELIFF